MWKSASAPFFFGFWCLMQSVGIYAGKLVTMNAAYLGARAAAVVLPDDPKNYDKAGIGEFKGKRKDAIEDVTAAVGTPATFVAEVQNIAAPTYRWRRSNDGTTLGADNAVAVAIRPRSNSPITAATRPAAAGRSVAGSNPLAASSG